MRCELSYGFAREALRSRAAAMPHQVVLTFLDILP